MSDFRIKVNVELDTSGIDSKLKSLGEGIELKLDTSKIESQLKSLKTSFQNAFKLDSGFTSDLNKITSAISNLNKDIASDGSSSTKSSVNELVNQYKDLANVYEKLQKQMNSGKLGEESIKRTALELSELSTKMSQLKSQMSDNALAKVELFDTKQSLKGLTDMNSAMTKIESTAVSLSTKINSISFEHIDSSRIEKIQEELKEIQDIAKQDIELDFNVGDVLSDLNKLSAEIKNLVKVEELASSFDRISSSVIDTNGDIEKLRSTILDLVNVAGSLDGSFEKAFSGASNSVKDLKNDIQSLNSTTSSGGGFFNSIFGDADDFWGNFAQFKVMDLLGDAMADGIRSMASAWKDTVVETDSAIRDLNKVYETGLSGDALDTYLNKVTEVAKGTGQSSIDIITGTTKAIQSGISDLDSALKFAEQSAIFANVGDLAQEEADSILAAIMSANGGIENCLNTTSSHLKSVGQDYSTLQDFIDQANYASNHFAVTTADIGTALQLSSSALSANGVEMHEQIAMATAMNEVLQDSSYLIAPLVSNY